MAPSGLMVHAAIYSELLSFSEKPRDTVILLRAAHERMVSISGESRRSEFMM